MTKSRLRRNISRWANSSDQEARDLRKTYAGRDCVRISEAPDREMVRLRGSLRTVSLRPRAGVPALEAELFDGSGVDRRRLARPAPDRRHRRRPLHPGARAGSVRTTGVRTLYNPRYELIP